MPHIKAHERYKFKKLSAVLYYARIFLQWFENDFWIFKFSTVTCSVLLLFFFALIQCVEVCRWILGAACEILHKALRNFISRKIFIWNVVREWTVFQRSMYFKSSGSDVVICTQKNWTLKTSILAITRDVAKENRRKSRGCRSDNSWKFLNLHLTDASVWMHLSFCMNGILFTKENAYLPQ